MTSALLFDLDGAPGATDSEQRDAGGRGLSKVSP
jgi:hypothetical protein